MNTVICVNIHDNLETENFTTDYRLLTSLEPKTYFGRVFIITIAPWFVNSDKVIQSPSFPFQGYCVMYQWQGQVIKSRSICGM